MKTILLLLPFASFLVLLSVQAKDLEVAPKPRVAIDLTGYKTVKELTEADRTQFRFDNKSPSTAGYLGIDLISKGNQIVIDDVDTDSPAEKVGLLAGDVLVSVAGKKVESLEAARIALRGHAPDRMLLLKVLRDGKLLERSPILTPISKPFSPTSTTSSGRAILGFQFDPATEGKGIAITRITEGGGAEKAGLKVGDIIIRFNDILVENDSSLRELLAARKPGDIVQLVVKRGGETKELKATMGSEGSTRTSGRGGASTGWDDRLPTAWKRSDYKLAIIGIEYSDVKHNSKITDADWEKSLFSRNTYTDKSATGQRVHGSMADYYHQISNGKLKVEGKFVGWVEASKKRMDYSTGSGTSVREKTALLTEVMDKLLARDKNALKDIDGVFFLFAGGRVQTTRGSLYWPHRSSFTHNGKRWPYFIVQEGGDNMTNISVFCHEFGHMLGLPDLYARPEVPGMEGVGVWCAMSQQLPNGRPQHFSAWCKEQLGWITPKVIDPRVKQKVILGSITESPSECIKVPVKADGSEYFLLENRTKRGFDYDLPAEGLLIWRVVRAAGNPQPVYLEESHGIDGPSGPRLYQGAVPFPSPANHSFTPFTVPSSKSQLGGGLDVFISNIRRLPDGRVTFRIGYEFQ